MSAGVMKYPPRLPRKILTPFSQIGTPLTDLVSPPPPPSVHTILLDPLFKQNIFLVHKTQILILWSKLYSNTMSIFIFWAVSATYCQKTL